MEAMAFLMAAHIRAAFLDFFKRAHHTVVRSSPLVPVDPTLLFTNAGMVQFKDVFTGKQTLPYRRATTAQKCVRAGGKHNDLDNVGRTARHHTFFEMLGNFSFGDYFKEEAIAFAWELLDKEFKIPKERLWFTVFKGEDGIPADEEAKALWQRIAGVSADRVLGLGKKENFWMMGDTGPQGPCSEIHFYQGGDIPCQEEKEGKSCLGPACDCDRFLEIWNLVFMQFERSQKDGPLSPLPAPSIDTGAGLERMASVIQGKRSNYDTDLFLPLLLYISEAAKKKYLHADGEDDVSMRVLADHCRATSFLIADGVMPSNVGRGYVLRSIMRRAIRHAVRLNLPEGFFASLCLEVTSPSLMGATYPELVTASSLLQKAVNAEDESFRKTLGRGMKLISEASQFRMDAEKKVMPGHVAFQLHDTYGFPLDLTQVIGREQGFTVDEAGFAEEMEKQRSRSKFSGSGDQVASEVYQRIYTQLGATVFTGYDRSHGGQGKSTIKAMVSSSGAMVEQASEGQEVEVFTSQTPFYGRAGGQVGDTGKIRAVSSKEVDVDVLDTWKPLPELIAHRVRVTKGLIKVGDEVELLVDEDRRNRTRKNHSATHLLDHVLRKVLGNHITQKGSYVGPDKLTFDFSHFEPLSKETRQHIEFLVNEAVLHNDEQEVTETDFEQARAMGAIALFGEKYGDKVRVMKLGESIELCGGTHVFRTGDIGLFKIISETSIAKGIRRIEAVTGQAALAWVGDRERILSEVAELFRVEPEAVKERVERLLDEVKQKDREIAQLKQKMLNQAGGGFTEEKTVAGVTVLVRQVEEIDAKVLREVAEKLRDQNKAQVVVIGGAVGGKVSLAVAIEKQLSQKPAFHAGILANKLAEVLGGKGGGRPDVAQAGGSNPEKLVDALKQTFVILEGSSSTK